MHEQQQRQRASARIEVQGVTKSFGAQAVLCGVDMTFGAGRVHGLIGENGSGKSTLIKVLSGYHLADDGRVLVNGSPLRLGSPAASHAAGLRFVHQHLGIVPQMSAVENMGLGLGFRGSPWIRWNEEVDAARDRIAALNIDMDVERPMAQARAVERTAVAIARAMRAEPGETIRLLVLDEPTASLPPAEVDVLFDVVRRSCAAGISVLYVSHRLDEVEQIADDVAVLRDGVLVGRRDVATTNRDELIAMMLGSEPEVPERERGSVGHISASRGGRSVLEVRGLNARTLDDVQFTVDRGEIVGVAGIDGSGREDLARALVGAIPAEGDVRVDGRPVGRLSPAGAAAAGLTLIPSVTEPGAGVIGFTAKENLTLATLPSFAKAGIVQRGREATAARDWIHRMDVRPPDPSKAFALLSGGNKQKVVLAKWLALSHAVYVLNEPTAGVDVGARRRLHELLRAQAETAGTAFLLCSSDLEELESTCRRVLVLRGGRVAVTLSDGEVTRANMLAAMSAGRLPEPGMVAEVSA